MPSYTFTSKNIRFHDICNYPGGLAAVVAAAWQCTYSFNRIVRHLGWYYVTLGTDTLGGSFVVYAKRLPFN